MCRLNSYNQLLTVAESAFGMTGLKMELIGRSILAYSKYGKKEKMGSEATHQDGRQYQSVWTANKSLTTQI